MRVHDVRHLAPKNPVYYFCSFYFSVKSWRLDCHGQSKFHPLACWNFQSISRFSRHNRGLSHVKRCFIAWERKRRWQRRCALCQYNNSLFYCWSQAPSRFKQPSQDCSSEQKGIDVKLFLIFRNCGSVLTFLLVISMHQNLCFRMRLRKVNQDWVRFIISFLPERACFIQNFWEGSCHIARIVINICFVLARYLNIVGQSGDGNEETHQGTIALMYDQILETKVKGNIW